MISLCEDEMGNMMGVCSDQYCAHGFVIWGMRWIFV